MGQNDLYTPKTKTRDRIMVGTALVVAALGAGVLMFPESGETPTTDTQTSSSQNSELSEAQSRSAVEGGTTQSAETNSPVEVEVEEDTRPDVYVN